MGRRDYGDLLDRPIAYEGLKGAKDTAVRGDHHAFSFVFLGNRRDRFAPTVIYILEGFSLGKGKVDGVALSLFHKRRFFCFCSFNGSAGPPSRVDFSEIGVLDHGQIKPFCDGKPRFVGAFEITCVNDVHLLRGADRVCHYFRLRFPQLGQRKILLSAPELLGVGNALSVTDENDSCHTASSLE